MKKKIHKKTFLSNLRESLGVATAWKMARCLDLPFTTYYNAELQPGMPSKHVCKAVVKAFGWEKVQAAFGEELGRK